MRSKKKQKKKYVVKKKGNSKQGRKTLKKNNNTKNIHNEIVGIIELSIGALIFLGFYMDDLMGIFGSFIKNFLTGLVGIPSVIIPIVLIIFPILIIFKKDKDVIKKKSLYTFMLLALISAIFQSGIYKYSDYVNRSPVDCVVKFYKDGNSFTGGGVIGGLISIPLLLIFQPLGTIIILVTASLITTILLTNISIFGIFKKMASSVATGTKAVTNGIKEGIENYQENLNNNDIYELEENNKKNKGMGFTFNIAGIDATNLTESEIRDDENNEECLKKEQSTAEYYEKNKSKNDNNINNNNNNNEKEQHQSHFAGDFTVDIGILPKEQKKDNKEEQEEQFDPDSEEAIGNHGGLIKETFYKYPPLSILNESPNNDKSLNSYRNTVIEGAKKLEETLKSFGVDAKVINVSMGPTVTRYELQPNAGVKVSRIVNLADDIALNLASSGVRIEAPIPGKAAVGIEVPNKEVTPVFLREVLESKEFNRHPSKVAFAVGKDISGECIIADIAKMPHMLIAGATGSGKSVCINSLIMSILYKSSPDEVKMLLIDPKVVELGIYNGIPHLLIPVVTDPKKAAGALNWAVQEMINRYKLFADKGVRDIKGYNDQISDSGEEEKLPSIIVIIDELSDLMMAAPGDVEDAICRLAQMARAAGMHLVVATQRPSVDVITGLIKANIPSRISFAVSSQVDSRTILDMGGAEKLLGKGDMLFYPTGKQKPLRVQGAFVSDKEVENTVEFIKAQCKHEYDDAIIDEIDNSSIAKEEHSEQECDELLSQAIEMVIEAGQASVSLVQRKFKVGYARAARMIDQMESRGIIGGFEGSKPRQVLISKQQWEEMKMSSTM